MLAAVKGFVHEESAPARPLIEEYVERLRLAKLGYRFDGEELDVYKAYCFRLISTEIDRHQKAALDEME